MSPVSPSPPRTKADPNAVISGDVPNDGQATIQLGGPGTSTERLDHRDGPEWKQQDLPRDHRSSRVEQQQSVGLERDTRHLGSCLCSGPLPYTVDVATGVSSLTVTATVQDSNASVMINGQGISSGQPREISPLGAPRIGHAHHHPCASTEWSRKDLHGHRETTASLEQCCAISFDRECRHLESRLCRWHTDLYGHCPGQRRQPDGDRDQV